MRPFPVPIQVTTIYTESRGNVVLSTVELRFNNGSPTRFETALFWDADEKNPDDAGNIVVENTTSKDMAYRNHKWWENTQAIESRIHRSIEDLRKQ